MRLWTVQPIEVYDILKKEGTFICDSSKSSNQELAFRNAYKWLGEKMVEKISKRPEGVTDPIWAWYRINWKNTRPDMREVAFRVYEPSILIEIEIPDEKVLLSDFVSWHSVLNHSYFNNGMTEEEWERNNEYFDSLPNKEKNKIMIESWNDIFDIEPFENEFMSNGRYVQATFWKLDISYVKKVWYLKGYAKPNYYNYNK